MDNLSVTIAVAVMYALMLLASHRAPVSDTQTPTAISTPASDTSAVPLFLLPDSAVTPDSATVDTTK